MERLPKTVFLALAAMTLAILVVVLAGIITGMNKPIFDYVSMLFVLFGLSMPVFWLGLMLLFSIILG